MRQAAAPEHDGVRSGETIFADVDRFSRLPSRVEIDAVSEELRAKTADGRERADANSRRAIDKMATGDGSVAFDDQFGLAVWQVSEMPARAAGKTGDPIQLADDGVRAEMEQIDVLAKRQVTDTRALFHDEAPR